MINRLISIIEKEIIQIARDPLLIVFLILAPVLELFIIGQTSGGSGANLPAALIDLDRSAASREAAAAIENTGDIRFTQFPATLDEATDLVNRGEVAAVVMLPDGLEQSLGLNQPAAVQVILDGTNIVTASDAQAAIVGALSTYGARALIEMAGPLYTPSGIEVRREALYNNDLTSYKQEMISLFGLIIFQIVLLSAVMTIVREREVGTLEQVSVTPIRGMEFVAGKAIAPILLSLLDFLFMLILIQFVFDIPIRGSIPLLIVVTLLYMIAEVGFALLFSAASRTQAQAVTFAFVWVMMALVLSGFLVPVAGLPLALRLFSWLLPLQHYNAILRAVMLKGAGLAAIWPNLVALAVIAILMTVITLTLLKRIGDS